MIFYYIRHGDPIYNPDSLTPFGHIQAEALSKRFERYGLDKIYCSTSIRAQMTAEPTCKVLNKTPILLDWANESNVAKFAWYKENNENTWMFFSPTVRKVFNSKETFLLGNKWLNQPFFKKLNCEQGFKDFDKNLDYFIETLGYKHDRENRYYIPINPNNDRVALFAHGGCGMAFLSSLLDIPYPEFSLRFSHLATTGVAVINFQIKDGIVIPELLQYGNDSHLYKEGIPPVEGVEMKI